MAIHFEVRLKANVHSTAKSTNIDDADSPQWLYESNETFVKVFSWTYALKGVKAEYNVQGNYQRPARTSYFYPSGYVEEKWERRKYNYITPDKSNIITIKLIGFIKYLPDLYPKSKKK